MNSTLPRASYTALQACRRIGQVHPRAGLEFPTADLSENGLGVSDLLDGDNPSGVFVHYNPSTTHLPNESLGFDPTGGKPSDVGSGGLG